MTRSRALVMALVLGVLLGTSLADLLPVRLAWSGDAEPAAQKGWLRGSPEEQLRQVEPHLRGLDVAMIEVGYRFGELYFAGKDRNWDYATYQLDKIELTTRLALERRPKRAASAAPFLDTEVPALRTVLAAKDEPGLASGMDRLRAACMKCHIAENVPWFVVEFPEQRGSPIRLVR